MTFMKYTFANRPVKSTPQRYEEWIKGLEREVRVLLEKIKNNPEAFYAEMERNHPNNELVSVSVLKELLGE
jgi:hypothetical protein